MSAFLFPTVLCHRFFWCCSRTHKFGVYVAPSNAFICPQHEKTDPPLSSRKLHHCIMARTRGVPKLRIRAVTALVVKINSMLPSFLSLSLSLLNFRANKPPAVCRGTSQVINLRPKSGCLPSLFFCAWEKSLFIESYPVCAWAPSTSSVALLCSQGTNISRGLLLGRKREREGKRERGQ